MKKRLLCLVLAGVMTLSLAACRGNENRQKQRKLQKQAKQPQNPQQKLGITKSVSLPVQHLRVMKKLLRLQR